MDELELDFEGIIREIEQEEEQTYIPGFAPEGQEDTRRFQTQGDTGTFEPVSADISKTQRFQPVDDAISHTRRWNTEALTTPREDTSADDTRRFATEPYSDKWEPEYEQPMGEYTPSQPIAFKPKSPGQELKMKLAAGPEKRLKELTTQKTGMAQLALFFSLLMVLISAISTGMYALGRVQENRLGLLIAFQFLSFLVSALLGSSRLIAGAFDMLKVRFTLNSLLAVTFLVCFVDGIICFSQARVPCCAAFSLQISMCLWDAGLRRNTEISQLETLCKAKKLTGIQACEDYYQGAKGLLQTEGRLADFMDSYDLPGEPENRLNLYALIATGVAFVIGVVAGIMSGFSAAVQVTAVSLLAAAPASAFICQSRPAWILQKRLHKLGTVLCGWQGVEGLDGNAVFPITFSNLFSATGIRLNGMKFFGNRESGEVIAYAAALIYADGSALYPIFSQTLDSHNGKHYDAYHLRHYENGGLGGVVNDEVVLIGTASFMRKMDIAVPQSAKLNYALYVAIEGELCGLFAISYEKTKTTVAGLSTLTTYKDLACVFVSDDFMITHSFIYNRFEIKPIRFLLPDRKSRKQLREQRAGEKAPMLMLTVSDGLAPLAYGVSGARVLGSACKKGAVLHMAGGVVGLCMMFLLVLLGALNVLTAANLFLYQLVWLLPALLITEWTRTV